MRRSIPAFNKDVKDIQARLEDVAFKLRIPQRKPWQGMADNIAASLVLAQQPDKVCLLGCLTFDCCLYHCPCMPVITSRKVKRSTMAEDAKLSLVIGWLRDVCRWRLVRWLLSHCCGLRWQCSAKHADEFEAVSDVTHDMTCTV